MPALEGLRRKTQAVGEVAAQSPAAGGRGTTRKQRLEALAVLLPLVTVALGSIGLGSKSLWYDETYTAWAIRGSWSRLWFLIEDHESPHAVYYALVKTWSDAVGPSEAALRLPSVVAAGLAVLVVYAIARRLFTRRAAAVGVAALTINPFVIIWSQQARSYALVLLGASLSTLALVHAIERPRPIRWLLYAAVASATLLVHLFAGLVLPAHVLAVVLRRRSSGVAAPIAAFFAIAVVAGALAVEAASRADILTAWLHTPSAWDVAKGVLLVAGVGPLVLVSAGLGAGAMWRAGLPSWIPGLLVSWALGPFVATVLVSFVEPVFAPRYLIGAVPPFALLTGYWLTSARRPIAVGFAAALATWSAVVLVFWYSAPALENWRAATADVVAASGGAADVLYAPPAAVTGFEYYAGRGVAAEAPATEDVWLLVWGSSPDRRAAAAQAAVGTHGYALAERRPVDGWLSVERWERRQGRARPDRAR